MSEVTIPITFDPAVLLAALGITIGATNTAPVSPLAPPVVSLPVVPPVVQVVPPQGVQPPELAGKRLFVQNVAWTRLGQTNRTDGNVIDATSAWLPQFVPTSNSARAGRLQIADAQSQSIFRDYILYRTGDGVVLQRQSGVSAMFSYWVGPGSPDPTGSFMVNLEVGVQYTLAVLNRVGVTESGMPALDIYQ